MATITLHFEPYEEAGADGIIIQESADGVSGWSTIETVSSGSIGSYPDYISSYTTSSATDASFYFRMAWTVGGIPTPYSEPVTAADLPPFYQVVDRLQAQTRVPALKVLPDFQVQELIEQAYYDLQDECGPFDETNVDFIRRIPGIMNRYVEILFFQTDPQTLGSMAGGYTEETFGSYSYRRSDVVDPVDAFTGVPDAIKRMVCRYGTANAHGRFGMETTDVFGQTPWFQSPSELPVGVDKVRVFTDKDKSIVAPSVYVWWRRPGGD